MTACTSKTNNITPLYISAHDTAIEAQCNALARAIDLHRPLQSMVALVVKIGHDRFTATLLARSDAEAMPSSNEKFTRALAAPPGDQLLLLMTDGRRSTAGFVSRDGCLEAALSPTSMLFCPLCANA